MNWITLDTRSNVYFDYRNQRKEFTTSNTTAYNRYRIKITQNKGAPYTQLAEFTLAGADTTTIDYLPDENGNLYGMKYNGTMYYYLRNGQNDVIEIIDMN